MRANEQWWTNPLRSIVLDPSRCACCEVTIAVRVLVQECEIWVTSNEQTPNLDCFPLALRLAGHFGPSCFEFVLFWNPKLCGMVLHLFVSTFSWTHFLQQTCAVTCGLPRQHLPTLQKHNRENQSFSVPCSLSLSPSLFLLPSLSFQSFHLIKAHGLSLLFTKYSLTKKKWEFLLIEDQSGQVSSSNPTLSIRAP